MKRRIIKIDEAKCNGCGLCAAACHEGAIGMVNGKAKLLRDDYCDGLGDCLPVCPTAAISFEERDALAYDEAAVKANMQRAREHATAEEGAKTHQEVLPCGCPGHHAKRIAKDDTTGSESKESASATTSDRGTELMQWPVQIKLVPTNAEYFNNANLLIAADCTAYAYASFHQRFMRNHITLIGCPKLDNAEYAEKLTAIIRENNIKSVSVVRMEVPCCGGIENAAKTALRESGKFIPWQIYTITTSGSIKE